MKWPVFVSYEVAALWGILLSMKRQWPSRLEASRLTLVTLMATVGLVVAVVKRFPLVNIALVFVALMLLALAYSIYRIIEDRKKP